ncbi:hypothetical protein HPC38_01765 [Pasteurellaceae bacterium HPA106]|uniref:hypothetical protein n=1 Tax=Spirabiliibacterium pneumoniae TaxID=221400 RepID=UPI001AACB4F2|nr:hypothetical protein [Spirabiliibacterium pneumoniae]MBE2895603.1 hypothetical protein [Spirabiliibacterium pneumoniae]
MTKQHIPGLVAIPLTIFLGISLYQTALGFEDLLGKPLAWAFSAGITVIMFYLTLHVGNKRINSEPITGLVLFYLICSLFSFSGNFNAVYTQYQTEQLYRDELTLHKEQLNETLTSSTRALNNFSPEDNAKKVKIEQLTEQLVRQINDPARPGLGAQAKSLVREIENTLGERLTEFAGSPKELAQKYEDNIKSIVATKYKSGDLGRAEKLIEDNKAKAERMNKTIDDVLSSSQLVKDLGYQINMEVVNTINEIGIKTQELIGDSSKYSFHKAQFGIQEIGKIAYSFKSGFTQHILVAFLFSIFCLFLDWAVVLYLIVRYGRGYVESYNPQLHSEDI